MSLRLRWPAIALVYLCFLIIVAATVVAQKPAPAKGGATSSPPAGQNPAASGTNPPPEGAAPPLPMAPKEVQNRFAPLDDLLHDAVKNGNAPGGVLLVGHDGMFVYRKAFGNRVVEPKPEPMTPDTIFDLASLTKVIATTTSVMRLEQLGQIKLNDPVAKYIPDFAQNGKGEVTIRQLLTHYSGLPADLDLKQPWSGLEEGYSRANAATLVSPPGSTFRYSDVGFIVLGELVQKVSGMPLDQYAQNYIFGPLGMTSTRFNPPQTWVPRIAPTQRDEHTGQVLRGVVHDPSAHQMGGVAGDAGLFSNADDVAKFAQALLNGGAPILSPLIVEKMTTPQQPANYPDVRGLGWDIDSPFSSNRGELLPVGSFGHTGFTGTSLWIDPTTNTFIILLTNAVNLKEGNVVALRTEVATAVAAALQLKPSEEQKMRLARITGYNEAAMAARRIIVRNGKVLNGIDVLEERQFEPLKVPNVTTARVGLLTNQTGVDSRGKRTIDVLERVPGAQLVAIFSPEHGVQGTADSTDIANSKDSASGVPIYSVYGDTDAKRRPSPNVIKNLDVLVVDLQDVGARFYTYATTMGYFLEAAAKAHKPIIVLDRPNPITGAYVQGPVSDPGQESFVNYYSLPVRHGMTMGELAKLFNEEKHIDADLTVIPMRGWLRGDWFDSTGDLWVSPSPNLRDLEQAALYPGVALIEGTNVSVGRGTDSPFKLVGAPWVDAKELASYLNERNIAGVRFVPTTFTPTSSTHARQQCAGVSIIVTNRDMLDAPELGLELAAALHKFYPMGFDTSHINQQLVNQAAFKALLAGEDPHRIAADWQDKLDQFMEMRAKYLIY
ncbi:MAG: exo-beta-N-acetylmuramidase NamZ domain-containing protein [Candidatus Korobacteraceae bacterium]